MMHEPRSRQRAARFPATLALAGLVALLAGCASGPESSEGSESVTNPDQHVTLVTPIPFADSAEVRDAVRQECQLQEKLAQFIEQFSADRNIKVATRQQPANGIDGKVLEVAITGVYAPGGGAFSGGKSVTVEGELTEDGRSLGSFKARRISSGGAFAMFKGTCDIVGRDVETLGDDIAGFLEKPSSGARMGNI
jgi:hypothetical protein